MDELTTYRTPWQTAKDLWAQESLELLIPAAIGLAMAQGALAILGLRSGHLILLMFCLAALGFSLVRSLVFFYALSRGERPELHPRDMAGLFAPLIAGVILYGLIAPNLILSGIFAAISLPHLLMLSYLAKHHARIVPLPNPLSVAASTFFKETALSTLPRMRFALARFFRKAPALPRS